MLYEPYEGCEDQGVAGLISEAPRHSWVSCEIKPNPNPKWPESHWILFDFGKVVRIEENQILEPYYRLQEGIPVNYHRLFLLIKIID